MKLIRLPSGRADISEDSENSLPNGATGEGIGFEMSRVDRKVYSLYATVVTVIGTALRRLGLRTNRAYLLDDQEGASPNQETVGCRTFPPVQHEPASCRPDYGDGLTSF